MLYFGSRKQKCVDSKSIIALKLSQSPIRGWDFTGCNDIDAIKRLPYSSQMKFLSRFYPNNPRETDRSGKARSIMLGYLSCWILLGIPISAVGQDQSLGLEKQSGILLLRNGQLLGGEYFKTGFGYEVCLKGGGIIRLQRSQVEFVSESVDEIYAFRRASRVNNSASAHLEMASWCLTNQMFDYARLHLQQAISINPREAGITAIQARLAIARQPRKHSSSVAKIVRPQQMESNEFIAEAIGRLDPATLKSFVNNVQPILLNKCALAGCHGPNPRSSFQLLESRWAKTIPQSIAYRNLFYTLERIVPNPSGNNLLITKAFSVHGGLKTPKLSIADAVSVGKLVNWVQLANKPSPPTDTSSRESFPHSPIIFKADHSQSNPLSGPRKVPVPSKQPQDIGSLTADGGQTDSDLAIKSQYLNETALAKKMQQQESFKDIQLSSDFDHLPLDSLNNGLLKVFSPPIPNRTLRTPSIGLEYVLPSDYLLNSKRSRTQPMLK